MSDRASESSSESSPDLRSHPWIRSILNADIANRTKDQYIRSTRTLIELAGGRPLEAVIAHPKTMFKRIDAKSEKLQTRKALVSVVKALAKHNPEIKEQYEEALEKWTYRFRDIERRISERTGSAEPTERELMNWVEWPEVLRKQQELGGTSYGSMLHLLLSMYSLIEPIRADLGHIHLIREGVDELPGPEENYIVLSQRPNESKLILQKYKTSNRYGKFERCLPEQLTSVIRTSLTKQPRLFLFVDESGRPYTNRNSYNRFANRLFERIFHKRFTISLLRHSFVSNLDFNRSTPTQLFQHSKNMMHSIGMQQMYRRRVPTVSVQRIGGDDGDAEPPRLAPRTTREARNTPRDPRVQGSGRTVYI